MDYEKLYNELKIQHENLQTTFDTYKENTDKEKEDLSTKLTDLQTKSNEEIDKLKQANIDLFLRIPKEPPTQPNTTPTQEKTITCDDVIKELGGL